MAAYLKLGDIKGEAEDSKHEDWIALADGTQHIHRPASSGQGGHASRAGSVHVEPMVITKQLDASTPKISELVCKGETIPEVEIHYCRADGKHEPYYEIKLKNVKIEDYMVTTHGTGEKEDSETMTLRFGEIEWAYTKFKGGEDKGKVKAKWKVGPNTT